MAITFTQQPVSVTATEGDVVTLTAVATTNLIGETVAYQWYEATQGMLAGETNNTLVFDPVKPTDTGSYYVTASDSQDTQQSDTAEVLVDALPNRIALVWNYEDDNFTWMQASVEDNEVLWPVVCMQYGFDFGWKTRWADMLTTWESEPLTWGDFNERGKEEALFYLSKTGVWKADQKVVIDGLKDYFVVRKAIAPNDFNPQWTSNNLIHIKQFYFHLQSRNITVEHNTFDIAVGWANNLMDNPDFTSFNTINLQNTRYAGKVKWDFRSTGRYMAMSLNFNETYELAMTGGDIDVELSHGR
jgi:hypothetical protein